MRRNSTVAALLSLALSASALAAPFTQGNIAVYRLGTGAAALNNAATPIFIDEYTSAGVLVQSIALPTSGTSSCTGSGSATSDGLMTRSADGQYLVIACYRADVGTASVVSTTAAANPRVVARIGIDGVIDTSTSVNDAYSAGNIRSAASNDGSAYWASGSNSGIRRVLHGGSTSGDISTTLTNNRQVHIFGGQLYQSTSSGTAIRIGTIGSGLPTSSGQTISNLPGFPVTGSPHSFFLADLSSSIAGMDTLYVADDGAGLLKYSLVAGTWTANGLLGTTTDDYRGLTGVAANGSVTLYAVRDNGGGADTLVTVTDTSGYNAGITGTVSTVATAAANTAFRSVALAPAPAPACSELNAVQPDNNSGGGIMFDMVAAQTLTIRSFEMKLNSGSASVGEVSIYYRPGTYAGSENSPAGWILAGTNPAVVPQGSGVFMRIPVTADVVIPAGQRYAFYVYAPDGIFSMRYRNAAASGDLVASDAALSVYSGVGKTQAPFTGPTFTFRQPVARVHYDTAAGGSANLAITKTDGTLTEDPGTPVTYTLVASNGGTSHSGCALVTDAFAPELSSCSWTCASAGGASCRASGTGNIDNLVGLPVGGTATFTATCNISASATGTLSNTGTITPAAGISDPNLANNSATDVDTLTALPADLSITKTDGATDVTAGGSTTYTITASNAGPGNVAAATVADTFPAACTSVNWTCTGAGGGSCTASGSGNINQSVNLPAGGSVSLTAACAISSAASGTLSNTATVSGGAVTDPTPGNNSASDTSNVLPPPGVDYCVLQFPASMSVLGGQNTALFYGRVYEDDNGVLTSAPGAHPSIVAQLGYGPIASNPSGGNPSWTWIPAAFNTQTGNDDEYQASFQAPYVPSTTQYAYTYRFSVDSGATFTYCDLDGNGTNAGLSFSAASLGTLTVNPNGAAPISVNDVSANEGNSGTTSFNFSVTLAGPSTSTITADIATADNTATVANNDYAGNSQSLTFAPGETSKSFSVLVNGDTSPESNETFFVNLTNIVNATASDAQGQGTIVNDDDPCLAYTFPHTVVGADNAARAADLVQAIQCANATPAADVIDLGGHALVLSSPADADAGLPLITSAIALQNGAISRSGATPFRFFYVSTTGNLTLARISLSDGVGAGITFDGGAIYNQGGLTLLSSQLTGNSGGFGGAIFNSTSANLTVSNSLIAGNRANNAGGAIRNRGILVLNNTTIAGNFTTAGSEGGGGIAIAAGSVTLNNTLVYGNESSTFPATNEISGTYTGNNSLVGVNPSFISPLDASDNAPTTGGDYRLGPLSAAVDAGDNALIPGGVTTDLDGNPRRFDDLNVPDTGAGTAPIVDIGAYERQTNSTAPVVTVTPTSLSLSETGPSTDSFVVALDTAPPSNVTIALSFDGQVQVDTGGGFGASPQTVTLTPANALAGVTVLVRAVDDAIDEASPHASAIITANTSSGAAAFNGLAVADVAVNILDNDTAGILVTESAGSTAVTEGGAGDSYSVVLLSQPTANISVNIIFDPSQLIVGGETDGTHALTFTPGNWNLAQTVAVTAVDDLFVENTVHTTPIVQTAASGDPVYNVINPADVNVSISENDTRSIVFASASGSVAETAGTHDIQARLELVANGAPGGSLAETISADVTLTPVTAEAGDLALASTTVAFAGGTSHGALALVSLTLANDRSLEGDETATVALALTTAPGTVGGPYTLTITDDETATIGFAAPTSNAPEGSTPHPVNATLTVAGSGSGPLQTEGAVSASLNDTPGTASTPADYTRTTASVSFAAGSASGATQPVLSSIVDDALFEVGETFTLGFTGVTGAGALGASGGHTVTIVDNDPQPVLSISSPSQNEGNAGPTAMNFVVTLTPASGATTSFNAATADGGATVANNDYVALASTPFTIPAGQTTLTIPVTINGDTVFEGNETFSVNLTGITNATPGTLAGTGTILEDDQQPTTTTITSDLPDPSVVGQPYPVNVTVTAQTLSPTGTVTISDGTASCGPVTLTAATAPNATASCSLTSTTAGAKTLTASYTAATTAFGNSSGTTAHQVNPASTSISVTGPTRSRINQPTAFTFALSVNAPGAGTPTGTVTLTSGASSCTATLPATSCSLSFNSLGSRTVSASYAGDGNFSASSSSGAGNAQTLVYALADLSVTKNDGVPTYEPGDLLVYSVIVRNLGPDAAANIRISDAIPAGLSSVVWSCDASGGVACPVSGGAGNLDVTIASFPVGGLLNFTFYGNVDGSPASIANTASITLPADTTIEDPALGNNTATDTDLLDGLFANGFEDPQVRAPTGSLRIPALTLARTLGDEASIVLRLTDAQGEAVRVYARLHEATIQYAVAGRGANGLLRLGAWTALPGEPTLSWTARQVATGWVVDTVALR